MSISNVVVKNGPHGKGLGGSFVAEHVQSCGFEQTILCYRFAINILRGGAETQFGDSFGGNNAMTRARSRLLLRPTHMNLWQQQEFRVLVLVDENGETHCLTMILTIVVVQRFVKVGEQNWFTTCFYCC